MLWSSAVFCALWWRCVPVASELLRLSAAEPKARIPCIDDDAICRFMDRICNKMVVRVAC